MAVACVICIIWAKKIFELIQKMTKTDAIGVDNYIHYIYIYILHKLFENGLKQSIYIGSSVITFWSMWPNSWIKFTVSEFDSYQAD